MPLPRGGPGYCSATSTLSPSHAQSEGSRIPWREDSYHATAQSGWATVQADLTISYRTRRTTCLYRTLPTQFLHGAPSSAVRHAPFVRCGHASPEFTLRPCQRRGQLARSSRMRETDEQQLFARGHDQIATPRRRRSARLFELYRGYS